MQITQKNISELTGKFIIQISSDREDDVLDDKNWSFYKEKRISFVCGLKLCGFYYQHKSFDTAEDFVEYFNNYIDGNKERFHRLLTLKEIDFVCRKLKESNY